MVYSDTLDWQRNGIVAVRDVACDPCGWHAGVDALLSACLVAVRRQGGGVFARAHSSSSVRRVW